MTGTSLARISSSPSSSTSIVTHAASPSSRALTNVRINCATIFSKPNDSTHAAIIAVDAPHIVDAKLASTTPYSQGASGGASAPQPLTSIVPLPLAS